MISHSTTSAIHHKPTLVRALLLLCLITMQFVWSRSVCCQVPTASPLSTFDVTSVRPTGINSGAWSIKIEGNTWLADNVPAKALIWTAFNVKDFQVEKAPAWASDQHYTIRATLPEMFLAAGFPEKAAIIRSCLQQMLIARFQLRYHLDKKEEVVYALQATNHLTLKAANESDSGTAIETSTYIDVKGYTMDDFARQLSSSLNRIVTNDTGITGKYSFMLRYVQADDASSQSRDGDIDKATQIVSSLPQQLGLQLRAVKAPVDILVIDNIGRPSPN